MSMQLLGESIQRTGMFPPEFLDPIRRLNYPPAAPNVAVEPSGSLDVDQFMPRQFTQQQYIPQQYTPQPYTLQQYAPPYAAQQMFFEPGAINDASVAAALAVLNRGPAGSSAPSQPQYQALTPDTYSNFYGPPLAANTEAYAGLAVPDYNDPNSPYLPQPEAPPPPPMTTVAPPRQIDSGADGSYGGGYEAASGSDIGAPVGGGIDMGVDAGLGGSGGGGGGKIICTAMNHAYGFGSFRNAIWIKYADKHLTKAHEVGYHTLFLPLVDFGFKRGDGKLNLVVRKVLEWGTRHRSTDLRAELRNKKRDTTGRIIRLIFEPLCYAVGKLKGY